MLYPVSIFIDVQSSILAIAINPDALIRIIIQGLMRNALRVFFEVVPKIRINY